MKNLILSVVLLLSSTSAFAGDLVLICEKEDHYIVRDLIDGRATIDVPVGSSKVQLKVRQITSSEKTVFNLVMLDRASGLAGKLDVSLFEEVKIGEYSCMIRD